MTTLCRACSIPVRFGKTPDEPASVLERPSPGKASGSEVLILELKGKMPSGAEELALHGVLSDALEAGNRNFLLDLSAVTMLDSSGFGDLVLAFSTARKANGNLKLLRPTSEILKVLELMQLVSIIEVFADTELAVASFELGTRHCSS